MTPQELEKLPISGGALIEHGTIGGEKCCRPVPLEQVALHMSDDDYACIFDSEGVAWATGTAPDGRKMRMRVNMP